VRNRLKAIFYALLSILISVSAYLVPMLVALLSTMVDGDFEVDEPPEERAVEYMASMSLTPFPDPSERVREVTETLEKPPKSLEAESKKKAVEKAELAVVNPKAKPQPVPKDQPDPAGGGDGGEGTPSGGKVVGPTQDGEGSKKQDCLPDNPDIKPLGANKYQVKRALIDDYSNSPLKAQRLADTHWLKKDGENFGFRVLRVRCGNDLYQLGFRGGDAVLSVNEEPVTSLGQAVEAYRKLRNKKRLRVKIRRNKKEMVLEYVLVE
jgi:hypothetical protein